MFASLENLIRLIETEQRVIGWFFAAVRLETMVRRTYADEFRGVLVLFFTP